MRINVFDHNVVTTFISINWDLIGISVLADVQGFSFCFLVILRRCGSPSVLPLQYNGYSSCEGKVHSEFVDSDLVLV